MDLKLTLRIILSLTHTLGQDAYLVDRHISFDSTRIVRSGFESIYVIFICKSVVEVGVDVEKLRAEVCLESCESKEGYLKNYISFATFIVCLA